MRPARRGTVAATGSEPCEGDAWAEVVRTAYLLTADHGASEELAAAALVRQRRRRSAGAPVDARRLVLRLACSLPWQVRRRSHGRSDPGDPFLAAYLGLSMRERALLLLRVGDGLDAPAAAATLGLRPRQARDVTVAALDALGTALPDELDLGELTPSDGGDDRAGGDRLAGHPVVPRLAALFAELSAAPPVVSDPARRVEEAAARARRRRNRLVVVAAGLVVAVVGAGLALEKRHAADLAEQQQAARRLAAEAALNPVVRSTDVTTWPTRGSLAGRTDLVAQVRAAAQGGDGGVVLAVPFVGDVAGLDVALAVVEGSDDSGRPARRLVALFGPGTQPVGAWERAENELVPDLPDANDLPVPVLTAALHARDDTLRIVVVTVTDGVSAAFSQRPRIEPQGFATRRFTAVPLRGGVGTVVSRGPLTAATLRLRWGNGPPVIRSPHLTSTDGPASQEPLAVEVAASCRGSAFANLRLNVDAIARNAAEEAGRSPQEIAQVLAVACRRVGRHTVMFTALRLTDGTALQTTQEDIREQSGHSFVGAAVHPVPWGRGATFPRYHRLHADADPPDSVVARTVLFCAPGGATAELVRRTVGGASAMIVKVPLAPDGVGVGLSRRPLDEALVTDDPVDGPLNDQVLLVVRDRAGRELETQRPVGVDPLGYELDGPVDGS